MIKMKCGGRRWDDLCVVFVWFCRDRECAVRTVCTAVRSSPRVTEPRECVGVPPTVSPLAGTCCSDARQSWLNLPSVRTMFCVQTKASVTTNKHVVKWHQAAMDVVHMKKYVATLSYYHTALRILRTVNLLLKYVKICECTDFLGRIVRNSSLICYTRSSMICLSVGLFLMFVSPAKPIEMPTAMCVHIDRCDAA